MNPNHRKAQGFTLIELLAAMVITAIIAGAGASILRLITGARQRLDAQVVSDQNASAAMSAITSALSNAYRSRLSGDELLEGTDDFDSELPNDRIRFFTVSNRQIRKGEPESDLHQVEFFLAQPDVNELPVLMRRTDPTRNDEPDLGGVVERVAGNVMGLNFSYFDGAMWRDSWAESLHSWPVAIQVELIIANAGDHATYTTATRLVNFPRRGQAQAAKPVVSQQSGQGGPAR